MRHRQYHAPDAGNFIDEILAFLDQGKTIILDLGNAADEMRKYFSDMLSRRVFSHQEVKFTSNTLGSITYRFILKRPITCFHEMIRIFQVCMRDLQKKGKISYRDCLFNSHHPLINRELLAQTENFFVGHMSSQDEANALAKLQVQFDGLQKEILYTRTPGYMRMMTFSNRFVVPVQVNKFEAVCR